MDLARFEFGTVHFKIKRFQYLNTKCELPNSIKNGKTARMYGLIGPYTDGKD
jgi:hypothetical protein